MLESPASYSTGDPGREVVTLEKNCENRSLSRSQLIAKAGVHATAGSTELYIRANAVVTRSIAGETLVLPVRGDIGDLARFYSLNGTGTVIWEALEKPKSFNDLCDVIDSRYDIGRKKAEEDVALFVRDICSLGLAKVVVDSENGYGTAKLRSADNHTARL
jgi:coenzyme PQQ synthesis protein D (PqqD)